jgi:hypothetical protein
VQAVNIEEEERSSSTEVKSGLMMKKDGLGLG